MNDYSNIIHHVGEKLPVTVGISRKDLPKHIVAEVNGLGRPTPRHFLFTTFYTWVSIALAIYLSVSVNASTAPLAIKIIVYLLTVVFIATRQNSFGLLVHEQAHRSGFKEKWGDYVANALTAFWLTMTVEGYRRVHLAHHGHFFTEKDPDFMRKQGDEWEFPQTPKHFLKVIVKDIFGLNILNAIKSKDFDDGRPRKPDHKAKAFRIGFYVVLAGVLTVTEMWSIFLLYWVVPLLTIMQLIVRWWAICEHRYNLVHPEPGEATPFIMLSWWERLILPMQNFNYHVYHHFFPYIGAPDLPKVHKIFLREGLVDESHIFHGYADYLRYLLRNPQKNSSLQTTVA